MGYCYADNRMCTWIHTQSQDAGAKTLSMLERQGGKNFSL